MADDGANNMDLTTEQTAKAINNKQLLIENQTNEQELTYLRNF